MILRRLKVSGWRCFANPVEIGPLVEGLNVLYAPNGTGKSTLLGALIRGLLDSHKVTGKDVEGLRPWGRSLSPQVLLEVEHDGNLYRIEKRFLESPESVLERREGDRFVRLAEGVAADDQVRAFLSNNPPGRGLARPENWGVAQVLWAAQSGLTLSDLSGDLVKDIRNLLDSSVTTEAGSGMEKAIEERYLQVYTRTGKLKSGKDAPSLTRLDENLQKAREKRSEACEAYRSFQDASARIEELAGRVSQTRQYREELESSLKKAKEEVKRHESLLIQRDQATEQFRAAEARHGELSQRIESIRREEKDLAETLKRCEEWESELQAAIQEALAFEKEAARRKAEIEDAKKEASRVAAAEQEVYEARRFVDLAGKHSSLQDCLDKLSNASAELDRQKKMRAGMLVPEPKDIRSIRKLLKERDEARLALNHALITLEIVAEIDGTLEVVQGEDAGPRDLKNGIPLRVQGAPEVVVELPGMGRVRASGPVGDVAGARSAHDKAEAKLKDLLSPYASKELDELEILRDKADQIEKAMAELQTQMEAWLAGKCMEDLEKERNVCQASLSALVQSHPAWPPQGPELPGLEAVSSALKKFHDSRMEEAQNAWQKAQSELADSKSRKDTLEQRLADGNKQVSLLRARKSELDGDGKSMSEREDDLKRFLMAWDVAKVKMEDMEKQLKACGESPRKALDKLDAQWQACETETRRLRDAEVAERTGMDHLASQGTYSALAAVEEEIARLEQNAKEESLRTEAIRILFETVSACRSEAVASVAQPVEAKATRLFQQMSGRSLGRIRMGEGFSPSGIVPESLNEPVSLESISGGEAEQLFLATRLALADVLRRGQRQLVVLDDVLNATDSGRLARVLTVLEEASQRLQILVLTCHPERYRGIQDAYFMDLAALLSSHSNPIL